MGGVTPRMVSLDSVRKQAEQGMWNKPVAFLHGLHQLLPPGS